MSKLDVKAVRDDLVALLAEIGFTPRDADGTDFQFQDERSLRFKVGTAYNEVTVIAVFASSQANRTLRATKEYHVPGLHRDIKEIIKMHWEHNTP